MDGTLPMKKSYVMAKNLMISKELTMRAVFAKDTWAMILWTDVKEATIVSFLLRETWTGLGKRSWTWLVPPSKKNSGSTTFVVGKNHY